MAGRATRISELVHKAAAKQQTPISLRTLLEFGRNTRPINLVIASRFLAQELPIRLARRVVELESAPMGLSQMPSVRTIHGLYTDSFRLISEFPYVRDEFDDQKFTELLAEIKARHNWVVQRCAAGVLELKKSLGVSHLGTDIQTFLDRFYMGRISIRMLISQHLALHSLTPEQRRLTMATTGYVGIVTSDCKPVDVINEAIRHAQFLCESTYGRTAPVQIVRGDANTGFTYVPSHLYLMVFELLKNSLRATVETHRDSLHLPPVKVVIAYGDEDVIIKISDEGGGVPRSALPLIWTYSYTTADPVPVSSSSPPSSGASGSLFDPLAQPAGDGGIIAGFGYGLPLSRLYARYFSGDIVLMSVESYGTDAFIHLRRLADKEEELPA